MRYLATHLYAAALVVLPQFEIQKEVDGDEAAA